MNFASEFQYQMVCRTPPFAVASSLILNFPQTNRASLHTHHARDRPHAGRPVRQPDRRQVLGGHLRRARLVYCWEAHAYALTSKLARSKPCLRPGMVRRAWQGTVSLGPHWDVYVPL